MLSSAATVLLGLHVAAMFGMALPAGLSLYLGLAIFMGYVVFDTQVCFSPSLNNPTVLISLEPQTA